MQRTTEDDVLEDVVMELPPFRNQDPGDQAVDAGDDGESCDAYPQEYQEV